MSPITHFLTGWALANVTPLSKRDRAIVTISGVIPDVDALGLIAERLTWDSERPLYWFSEYHHVLAHNVGFALAVGAAAAVPAKRRFLTVLMALLSFHLHLAGDIVGGRGPDGYQWPIPYLLPFSDRWQLKWDGQWVLNAWPNMALTAVLLGLTLYWAWKKGFSPLEFVSRRADRVLIATLRHRFGQPPIPSP